MSQSSFKKNIALNGIQQAVTLLLPIVTVPYLTRILGAEGIGIYQWTNSVVQYFILFGTMGLSLFGTRQIAYDRGNDEKKAKTFWQILFLRLFFCCFALVIYFVFLYILKSEYKDFMLIQSVMLVSNAIDITWFYQGIEDFEKVVTRSVIGKIIGTICIFVLVKSKKDIAVYTWIQCLTSLIVNLMLWIPAFKLIPFKKTTMKESFAFCHPAIALFIPQIAIEVYAMFDKTMLGYLAEVRDVGLYSKAEEFAKIPITLISVVATVLFPRMSNLFAEKGKDALKSSLNNNIKMISFVGIGASFGVAGIADKFVPWMMGEEFYGSIVLMKWLAPLSFFIGLSNMIGRQYLLPTNNNRRFTLSVACGAFINFILNYLLIIHMGVVGACVATLIAEMTVTIMQFFMVRKEIDIKTYFYDLFKCLLAGVVMFCVVTWLGEIVTINVLNTILQIIAGAILYVTILIFAKNPFALQILTIGKTVTNKICGRT